MSLVVVRAMLLSLVRDRAALAMSFLLPVAFFLVFATIFAGATGEQLRLKVAMADEVHSDVSGRLLDALTRDAALLRVGGGDLQADTVRRLVRKGTADVGLVVRAGGESLESFGGFGPPPLVIISDPIRGVAAPMLAGQIQKAYFSALPDVALGNVAELLENEFLELSEVQREDLESGLEGLREDTLAAIAEGRDTGSGFQDLFEVESVTGHTSAVNHVAYYAGAVAVMFLLFSSVHGAISFLEERDSGVLDRILAGPGSVSDLVRGKFLFLVLQGFVQVGVIFGVAWLVYGVDLPGHLDLWIPTTLAASAAASGLALTVVTACRSRRQAQTVANVAILILSALGGSMVPRFFMPAFLQELGWITPNTWALEAYTAIFWRDETASALLLPWAALLLAALLGWLAAGNLARRMVRS